MRAKGAPQTSTLSSHGTVTTEEDWTAAGLRCAKVAVENRLATVLSHHKLHTHRAAAVEWTQRPTHTHTGSSLDPTGAHNLIITRLQVSANQAASRLFARLHRAVRA